MRRHQACARSLRQARRVSWISSAAGIGSLGRSLVSSRLIAFTHRLVCGGVAHYLGSVVKRDTPFFHGDVLSQTRKRPRVVLLEIYTIEAV
jgi:hypothetical protein